MDERVQQQLSYEIDKRMSECTERERESGRVLVAKERESFAHSSIQKKRKKITKQTAAVITAPWK